MRPSRTAAPGTWAEDRPQTKPRHVVGVHGDDEGGRLRPSLLLGHLQTFQQVRVGPAAVITPQAAVGRVFLSYPVSRVPSVSKNGQ